MTSYTIHIPFELCPLFQTQLDSVPPATYQVSIYYIAQGLTHLTPWADDHKNRGGVPADRARTHLRGDIHQRFAHPDKDQVQHHRGHTQQDVAQERSPCPFAIAVQPPAILKQSLHNPLLNKSQFHPFFQEGRGILQGRFPVHFVFLG